MSLQNLAMEVEDFRANLEEQLAEVELLQAMFPGEDELEIEEGGVEEMNAWLSGDTPASLLPSPLELRLRLEVGVGVELIASLPPGYPFKTLPELYLRGNRLSRKVQGEVNGELGRFLTSQVEGETVACCLVTLCQPGSLLSYLLGLTYMQNWPIRHLGPNATSDNYRPLLSRNI